MLSDTAKEAILDLQKQYPRKRSALIPALQIAQKEIGYLPPEIQAQVADLFQIAPGEVTAVIRFYDMFHEHPVGKHVLHVCKNVSCMLRGADHVIETLCEKLKAAPGEVSPDGKFTVVCSECLGACDKAPMMIADETVIGPIHIDDIDKILHEVSQGDGHHG